MANTLTANIKIRKPAAHDASWDVPLNQNADDLDLFLGRTCVGNPNILGSGATPLPAVFIGQRIYYLACRVWWICVQVTPSIVWEREIPRGLIWDWSGAVANVPPGWCLADGRNVVLPDATITTPDLRGMMIVGYSGTDSDYNIAPDNLSNPKTGGHKTVTVGHDNIEQFPATSSLGFMGFNVVGGATAVQGGSTFQLYSQVVTTPIGKVGATGLDIRPPYYTLAKLYKL